MSTTDQAARPHPTQQHHHHPLPTEARLSPFPLEVLERVLALAEARTRASSLRVNSLFYAAGVRAVYHTVKIGHGLAALPLSINTRPARHVHILDLGADHWLDCHYNPSYPPPLPNLRTLRIGSNFCLSFKKDVDRGNYCVVDKLRPRTLVLRSCTEGGEQVFRSAIGQEELVFPPVLDAVDEVVCVFDTATKLSMWLASVILHKFRFGSPVKFTFVFWTKRRGDQWLRADSDFGRKDGLAFRVAFTALLITQLVPDGGGPLLTIVNAGAIPSCFAISGGTTTPSPNELTAEERAIQF